ATAVAGAVHANQAAWNRQAGGCALTSDTGVGDRAAQVEDDVLETGGREADFRRRRRVVADLELVGRGVAQQTLQVDDRVGRLRGGLELTAGDPLRLLVGAIIVRDAHVGRPVVVHLEVETRADRVLTHLLKTLQLGDVEVRVGRRAGQDDRTR